PWGEVLLSWWGRWGLRVLERPESGISIITPCTGVRVVSRGRDEASQHGCGTGRNGHGLDRVRYARHRPRTVPGTVPLGVGVGGAHGGTGGDRRLRIQVGRDRAGVPGRGCRPARTRAVRH